MVNITFWKPKRYLNIRNQRVKITPLSPAQNHSVSCKCLQPPGWKIHRFFHGKCHFSVFRSGSGFFGSERFGYWGGGGGPRKSVVASQLLGGKAQICPILGRSFQQKGAIMPIMQWPVHEHCLSASLSGETQHRNALALQFPKSQPCTRPPRGPAAILFISLHTCSDSIAKLFRACFCGAIAQLSRDALQNGVSHRCACVELSAKKEGGIASFWGSANLL